MKSILFTLLLTLLPFSLQGLSSFTQANEAYQNKDFSKAIKLYKESLVASQSLEQHLNIANAYYENKDYGHAILHYEKALIFDPHSSIILKNLGLVNEALKINTSQTSIFENFAQLLPANTWFWILITSLVSSLLLFIFFLVMNSNKFLIIISLSIGAFIIAICLILHNFYSHELNIGIILTSDTQLRVSPTSASPHIALLSAGSKIQLTKAKQSIPGWVFITLKNQEGWVNSESFGLIWQ